MKFLIRSFANALLFTKDFASNTWKLHGDMDLCRFSRNRHRPPLHAALQFLFPRNFIGRHRTASCPSLALPSARAGHRLGQRARQAGQARGDGRPAISVRSSADCRVRPQFTTMSIPPAAQVQRCAARRLYPPTTLLPKTQIEAPSTAQTLRPSRPRPSTWSNAS